MVLEYEQREAAHRAVAHSTYSTTAGEPSDPSAFRRSGSSRRLLRQPRPGLLARRPRTVPWRPVPAPRVAGREQRVRSASTSVTTGTVRRATPAPSPTTRSYASKRWLPSAGRAPWPLRGGKGGGKGGGKAGAARPSRRPPLSRRRSLLARSARSSRRRVRAGRERTVSLPAADPKGAVREHALALIRRARAAASRRSTSCRRLVVAGLWFRCWAAASSACSTGALGRTMSPRTEELLVGMLKPRGRARNRDRGPSIPGC